MRDQYKRVRTPDGKVTHAVKAETRRHIRVSMETFCGLKSLHNRLTIVRTEVDCKPCAAALEREKND